MRLRGRVLASFTYLLVLAVIALAIPLGVTVQRRARADQEARLSGNALVIAASLVDVFAQPDPRPDLRALVRAYAGDVDARVVIVDEHGTLLADSDAQGAPPPEDFSNRPEVARALAGERILSTRFSEDLGEELLIVAAPVIRGARVVGAVRLSEGTAAVDRRVRFSWLAIALVGALVLGAGLAIAYALARSLLGPLRSVQQTAAQLASGDLSARAPERGPPDIAEVARALNGMAADLERSISAQRDFVANASHQLRTPLTGLRLRLESLPANADVTAAIAEVDRLNKVVDDLLRLERARAAGVTRAQVSLSTLARAAAERWRARASAAGQTIVVSADPAEVSGDAEQLAMALDNLIENSIVYSPAGATVTIQSGRDESGAFVRVADTGPGIAPEDLPRVRERFYRGKAGKANPLSSGLGLAVVETILDRHKGILSVEADASGTRATLRFTDPLPTAPQGGRPDLP